MSKIGHALDSVLESPVYHTAYKWCRRAALGSIAIIALPKAYDIAFTGSEDFLPLIQDAALFYILYSFPSERISTFESAGNDITSERVKAAKVDVAAARSSLENEVEDISNQLRSNRENESGFRP